MHPNEELITSFYTCFQKKDYAGMQQYYADNARFSDEVFKDLNAAQVRAMWEMLLKKGKDLSLEFGEIKANDLEGSAKWIASYTFSQSGRQVVNHISARFRFDSGKIIEHTDQFSFYKWARQALGLSGWLLGWTPAIKKKVQQTAMKGLAVFMLRNKMN
jgi:hypothetical protein